MSYVRPARKDELIDFFLAQGLDMEKSIQVTDALMDKADVIISSHTAS